MPARPRLGEAEGRAYFDAARLMEMPGTAKRRSDNGPVAFTPIVTGKRLAIY
jgi:hypothetical protein